MTATNDHPTYQEWARITASNNLPIYQEWVAHRLNELSDTPDKLDLILAKLERIEPLVEFAEKMLRERNTFMRLFKK
jgi:hypothetical protein